MSTRRPVCDYEGSAYQEQFWERGGREYEDACEAQALQRLLPGGGHELLELGAGAGRNSARYAGFERIVLLDYSRTQLAQARSRLGPSAHYLYVAADIYQLPFVDGCFEAATMIRTLHHMADAPAALREVRRVLCAQAILVLEYANKRNLKAIARYLAGRQAWSPFTREPIEFAELNFDFHPQAVRDWLHASGFLLQRQVTVSHLRLPLLKRRLPLSWLVAVDGLLGRTGNWWQLSPSVFARAQALGGPAKRPGTLFRCPACGGETLTAEGSVPEEGALRCDRCGRAWAARQGIYDFKSPIGSARF